MTPSGTGGTFLHEFREADGKDPQGALVQAADGNLYGTTRTGGAFNLGVFFRLTLTGTYTLLNSFNGAVGGAKPDAPLILGSDGNLYGMTSEGDKFNAGTVFRTATDGTFTALRSLWTPILKDQGRRPPSFLPVTATSWSLRRRAAPRIKERFSKSHRLAI